MLVGWSGRTDVGRGVSSGLGVSSVVSAEEKEGRREGFRVAGRRVRGTQRRLLLPSVNDPRVGCASVRPPRYPARLPFPSVFPFCSKKKKM